MNDQKIIPEKVTRPIQLLAAWLVGLVAINATFLAAAASINEGEWERSALIIAAIINVPLFLAAFFLLQTKFRAELQEDSFYYQYLNKKTNKLVSVRKETSQDTQIIALKTEIKNLQEMLEGGYVNKSIPDDWGNWAISINDFLDDFLEIRDELRKNHIPLSSIFGSTNKNSTKPPLIKVVSFNQTMDFKVTLKLLRILSKFQLDGYAYFEPNEADTDHVYIGAYGYDKDKEIFPFSQGFKEFIQKDIEKVELKYFEDKVNQSEQK